jgi:hypothetical protein
LLLVAVFFAEPLAGVREDLADERTDEALALLLRIVGFGAVQRPFCCLVVMTIEHPEQQTNWVPGPLLERTSCNNVETARACLKSPERLLPTTTFENTISSMFERLDQPKGPFNIADGLNSP